MGSDYYMAQESWRKDKFSYYYNFKQRVCTLLGTECNDDWYHGEKGPSNDEVIAMLKEALKEPDLEEPDLEELSLRLGACQMELWDAYQERDRLRSLLSDAEKLRLDLKSCIDSHRKQNAVVEQQEQEIERLRDALQFISECQPSSVEAARVAKEALGDEQA